MKFLTVILTLLFTSQAFAHVDHALGEGEAHMAYHVVFYSLLALVAYKGIKLLSAKKKDKKN